MLVAGEAGIGKSRLTAEARARAAARGFQVLLGTCFETDRTLPYAPFVELLRDFAATHPSAARQLGKVPNPGAFISLAPELRELLPEVSTLAPIDIESAKRDAFRAFRSLFSNLATTQPLLIVLEDLHWSDEASTELVLHLARQARTSAIVLLLTFRSDEVQARA